MLAVRIARIEICKLKNVAYGRVDLLNDRYRSSVLGLYGQNGSGKTTLINALSLLKTLMSGRRLKADTVNLIAQGQSAASLAFDFVLSDLDCYQQRYYVTYQFDIKPEETFDSDSGKHITIPYIVNEKLEYREYKNNEDDGQKLSRKKVILDTSRKTVAPQTIFAQLQRATAHEQYNLELIRGLALTLSQSFVFHHKICQIFCEKIRNPALQQIMESLQFFAAYGLYCIESKEFNLITSDLLLVHLKKGLNDGQNYEAIPIVLSSEIDIPEIFFKNFNSILDSLNIVLTEIIPGLSIEVEQVGQTTDKNGLRLCRMAVYSCRNNGNTQRKVALQLESDGIKKIISILQLLIYAYNSKNITIAIDELDAGIFEYLLGEILSIFSTGAKGQLIFTSHNLRPLEIMDKIFVAFTTVNANKRYVRPYNIKKNNNLRDVYYRDIQVKAGEDAFYDATDSAKLQLAFSKAGRINNGV